MRSARLLACGIAVATALAGCGLGPGEERTGAGVELRVTRDFGNELLLARDGLRIREDETAMRLLKASADVETRFGGGFVQAIDGVAGGGSSGTSDWFFYVNGIEAAEGAADFELSPGDVVQWDHRDWGGAMDVRAIVGAFPQPFRDGFEGRRLPVRVECEDPASAPCQEVERRLRDAGVPVNRAALGAPGNQDVARVVVAEWRRARELPTARLVELGPRRSGVFGRFVEGGAALELLTEDGRRARTEGPGAGLVAALRPTDDELVWLVTGTDSNGLQAAAGAFRARDLRDAFAVAVAADRVVRLPLRRERR
jgi:Domain of unknown function (DUF4430)